jgi:hypothetical protein
MSEELIFRIRTDKEGKEVSLDNMSVETAELLQSFIQSLSALAKLQADPLQVSISVRAGSLETAIAGINAPALLATTKREERKILAGIQSTIQANGWGYTVLVADGQARIPKDITESFVEQRFTLSRRKKSEWHEEVQFLTGEFDLPGGKTTNFHLNISDDTLVIGCTRAQVRRYLPYDVVRVSILKRYKEGRKAEYHLIDFYTTQSAYEDFSFMYKQVKNDPSLKRYDAIRDFIVLRYNENNYVHIAKLMKLYSHVHADMGLVNTILMALKPVLRPPDPNRLDKDKMASVRKLFTRLLENFRASNTARISASMKG